MKKENNDERSHFVISANAAYGLVITLLLGGAGGYGTIMGQLPQGVTGQCPDHSEVALSLAERNGRELADIRDIISDSSSLYRKEEDAEEAEEKQRDRDSQQDRRASLVERELKLHKDSHAVIQPDK